ncbi:hypothetical protein BRD17_02940 [Halobacteriales archaeon SW_7_68_16]|nr:MAG: hypothetical protein BRD17_02940 [Halobacteriales archaeon SW_7_68_16]
MRFKPVPPAPDDLDGLARVRDAVPLVPGSETDCCARLIDRAGVPARDEAKTWLTLLRALELIERTETGYRRCRRGIDREDLARAFRARVDTAATVLDALDDEPRDATAVFAAVRATIPDWERRRSADPEGLYRERVTNLLDWAVLLGLAERRDGGYVTAGA